MGCEDCGDFIVAFQEHISLFSVDEDIYAMTRCPYCDRVVKNICSVDMADKLISADVKFFSWNDGEHF